MAAERYRSGMRYLVFVGILASCDGRAIDLPNGQEGADSTRGGATAASANAGASGTDKSGGPGDQNNGNGDKNGGPSSGSGSGSKMDAVCMTLRAEATAWVKAHQSCHNGGGHGSGFGECTLVPDDPFGGGGEPVWGCDPLVLGSSLDRQAFDEIQKLSAHWQANGCSKAMQCPLMPRPNRRDYACIQGTCQKR